jgi:hypothetical protein
MLRIVRTPRRSSSALPEAAEIENRIDRFRRLREANHDLLENRDGRVDVATMMRGACGVS